MFSFFAHVVAVLLLMMSGKFVVTHHDQIRQQVVGIVTDVRTYILPASNSKAGGGSGGGNRDKLPASRGALPRFSQEQLVTPALILRNENPTLLVEPSVVVPPEMHLTLPQTGTSGILFLGFSAPHRTGLARAGGDRFR